MHVTLQTLSVNPAKVHERFCPVHGFRHQPRTWRCDPATSSEGAGRFPLQRWFVLVDFLPAVWGRCTRARFSNSAPPRPLWSANISSQVTRPPSPVDIRDVTRRGLTSRRVGNQTRFYVDADRPELWLGVAPGFLAPARSVGGPISHGSWWNTSNSTPSATVPEWARSRCARTLKATLAQRMIPPTFSSGTATTSLSPDFRFSFMATFDCTSDCIVSDLLPSSDFPFQSERLGRPAKGHPGLFLVSQSREQAWTDPPVGWRNRSEWKPAQCAQER